MGLIMGKTINMNGIYFASQAHKDFYFQMLDKANNHDSYHRSFFYTMGICVETRRNINTLFDFKNKCIQPERLYAGWQTGSTSRLCRLAFNLWNGWTEQDNKQSCTPYALFDCTFAPFYFQAIQLRYPQYCLMKEHTTFES